MSYELIEMKQYKLNINGEIYLIFVKDKEDLTEFYIQKETYGIISFIIGVYLKEAEINEKDFIEANINEWVNEYEK